ncbi:uncharacterized protein SAMN02745857_02060 [Andreprevotia lacus DSM 23236]|jgi:uncharacterized protein|uniref:YecA family protein n=1 Tax=Andreprevotia lacus DSM 23236 TaxID=1121001 RepID=A0A1W1XMC1_9NEIS|nr:UPF0149 family protein [Andreprevotia lacus]SMC25076.1 uncharacterized protein SAMN02745857_02060 [Andreprevotia lacus DSM 23236]
MSHTPLNESELEYLDTFLMGPTTPDETMDLEMVDGFFVALTVGPEDIAEDEWLPQIFAGQTPEFSDQNEADEILGLIRRHYQTVQDAYSPKRRGNVGEEPLYLPLILEDEGVDEKWKETLGAYWASGFRVGILAREDLWQAGLDEDEEFFDTVAGILALEGNDGEDEDLETLDIAQREERLAELPWLVEDAMFYWLEKRYGKVETVRNDAPKVGRNDPCPCGSGKKYKKCHGA